MACGLFEDPGTVLDAAALGVVGTEKQPPHPGQRNRRRAHGAGLQGYIQIALVQMPAGFADHQHFGVRGGIVQFLAAVAGPGNDAPRAAIDQHRADRDLAPRRRPARLIQCIVHKPSHGANLPGAAPGVKRGACRRQGRERKVRPMSKPVIGITLDQEKAGGYSKFPWYALRCNYAGAVAGAGGLPMALPHDESLAADYLDNIDGLIITGGDFDVDPALFGASERHQTVKTKDRRTAFEVALCQAALARDMPVLGICGGQQLLHVLLGGRLIQHIPDDVPGALPHEQPNPRDEAGHDVDVVAGTLLHDIVRTETLSVNSAHHQAALDQPVGVVVNARAPDGVIEGIEAPAYRFCLGVQWHPEFLIDPGDRLIMRALIKAASQ